MLIYKNFILFKFSNIFHIYFIFYIKVIGIGIELIQGSFLLS